jgi:hypothetical protein
MLTPENNKLNPEQNAPSSNNLINKIKGNLTRTPKNNKKNSKKRYSVMGGNTQNQNRSKAMDFNIDMTELDSVNEKIEFQNNQSRLNLSLDLNNLRKISKSQSGKTICSLISTGKRTNLLPPSITNPIPTRKSSKSKSVKLKTNSQEHPTTTTPNKEDTINYWKKNNETPVPSFPIKTLNISVKGSFSSVTSLSEPSDIKSSDEISKKLNNTESQDYLIGLFLGMFFNVFGVLILCCQRKRKKSIEGAVHGAVISGLVFVFMIHTFYIHRFVDESAETNQAIKGNLADIDNLFTKDKGVDVDVKVNSQESGGITDNKAPDKFNI